MRQVAVATASWRSSAVPVTQRWSCTAASGDTDNAYLRHTDIVKSAGAAGASFPTGHPPDPQQIDSRHDRADPRAAAPADENSLIAERRAKLGALRGQGIAYPNDFVREHFAGDLQAEFADADTWTPTRWRPAVARSRWPAA